MNYKKIIINVSTTIFGFVIGVGAVYIYGMLSPNPEKHVTEYVPDQANCFPQFGDTVAYNNEVDSIRKYTPGYPTYFGDAFCLANYYNYPKANLDIYQALVDVHKYHHLGEMDPDTKKLAIFYLERYKQLSKKK